MLLMHFQLVRESGKTLGFVITGGRDTPIEKVLIKEVEPRSLASTCSIPLKAGDELLEVNQQDVTGKNSRKFFSKLLVVQLFP